MLHEHREAAPNEHDPALPASFMRQFGQAATKAGFNILPIKPEEKVPGSWSGEAWSPMSGWQRFCDRQASVLELAAWERWPGAGIGVACGSVVGIDLDADDPARASAIRLAAEQQFGRTPLVRHGRPNRALLVYRAGPDIASTHGRDVDALAHGRQFVAWGIHPLTRQPYRWEAGTPADIPLASLPEVTAAQVTAFLAAIDPTPLEDKLARGSPPKTRTQSSGEPATAEAVESALAALDPAGCEYSDWIDIGMAVHAGLGEAGLALWDAWSARDGRKAGDGSPRYKPGGCAQHWSSFGPGGIGVGSLFKRAHDAGWNPPPGIHFRQSDAARATAPNPAQRLIDNIGGRGETPAASAANDNGLEFFDTIRANLSAQWRVRGLLPERALALVYGDPGTGKSFLVLDIVLAVARGIDWFGRRTRQGGVVYLAAEGQEGIRRRIEAYRTHYGVKPRTPFALAPFAIDLFEGAADIDRLVAWVEQAGREFGQRIELIVIDTVSRTIGSGDENTRDMTAYINHVGEVMRRTEAGVLLVHHRPKNRENITPRGHGSLLAAVDTCILVEGAKATRTVSVQKQKDGDPGEPIQFDLQDVPLGYDDEGAPVGSCVILPPVALTGNLARACAAPGEPTPTGASRTALCELLRLIAVEGVAPPDYLSDEGRIDPGVVTAVVQMRAWQAAAIAAEGNPEQKPATATRMFRERRAKLEKAGLIAFHDKWVWATRAKDQRTPAERSGGEAGWPKAQAGAEGGAEGITP